MKRRVSLSILFFVFLTIFVSCNWFNTNDDNEISFTITGKLITNGAMPQNYDEAMNARTALATAPSGKTIQYKVLLLAAEGATEPVEGAVSEVASDGSSYTIRYTGSSDETAQYYLRAVAYYMDGSNEVDVLLSPDTPLQNAINLKQGSFSKDLEMRPAASGYGEVSLAISLSSTTLCDSVTISDETHFQVTKSDSSVTISHKATSAENPKVASGSYTVTVSFYKSTTLSDTTTANVLVYQFTDVINVFNNLTTNTWVDNGNCPHLTTTTTGGVTTTQCKITDALLEAFKTTNFYVTFGAAADGLGTFIKPFNSLEYAVKYINSVGNDTDTYTIHIQGDPVDPWDEHFSAGLQINKNITIECYKNLPGKKDGSYIIRKSTDFEQIFSVSAGKTLTFESDGGRAHETDYYTNGLQLFLPGNTNGVEIAAADGSTPAGRFIMKGGRIYNGNTGVKASGIFEMYGGGISTCGTCVYLDNASSEMKVSGTPYIYGSMQIGGTPGLDVRIKGADKYIKITGPLTDGIRNALIGIYKTGTPTIADPIVFTSGYGYQTGGYNAGVKPGRYFRGNSFGVTDDSMLESPAGEAVLAVSGGSISTKVKDDITIEIDHTNASNNADDRKFTFTVTKDKGAVAPATSTDLTSAEGLSYSYRLKDHADIISNSPTAYYSTSANTLTLNTNLPGGKYKLEVEVTWDGNKYQAAFDVGYVKVDVPSGCVAVMGSTWNSSTTLCDGDPDRLSRFFIAGRKLTIPNLIACDHEVTQAEYEMYMTYSSGSKPTQTSAQKSTYPVYWVNWYSAMIYCNLRTLDDDTFGDTREERLAHCVYSFNGEKDPELWLDSNISGTSIYKSSGKFYNSASSNTTTLQNLEFNMDADGWRLPLDVEWEYLARGGNLLPQNQTPYSGSDSMNEVSWNASNSGDDETSVNPRIHEIKTRKPNNLKIYDMSGNISEWCQDWSLWDGEQNTGIQVDTPITGLTITEALGTIRKSERGGHWGAANTAMTINLHLPSKAFQKYANIGFRVVRTVLE